MYRATRNFHRLTAPLTCCTKAWPLHITNVLQGHLGRSRQQCRRPLLDLEAVTGPSWKLLHGAVAVTEPLHLQAAEQVPRREKENRVCLFAAAPACCPRPAPSSPLQQQLAVEQKDMDFKLMEVVPSQAKCQMPSHQTVWGSALERLDAEQPPAMYALHAGVARGVGGQQHVDLGLGGDGEASAGAAAGPWDACSSAGAAVGEAGRPASL